MRLRGRFVAAVASAGVLLAGCTGGVATDIVVRGSESADIQVVATFTGEAAEVFDEFPELLDEGLLPVFDDHSNSAVRVERSDGNLMVRTSLSYEEFTDASAITGVSSFTLSGQESEVTAVLELRSPTQLLEAIGMAVQSQPDALAVLDTIGQTTILDVSVTFPGGINGAPSVDGLDEDSLVVEGDTVTFSRPLAAAGEGVLRVSGNPNPGIPWLWIGIGGAGLLAVGAVALARRQDQLRPLNA